MTDSPDAFVRHHEDLIYSIILMDTMYIIAYAEGLPTLEQMYFIQKVRDEDPIMRDSENITEVIERALMKQLEDDFERTSRLILANMFHVIEDSERCERIFSYCVRVAMGGYFISRKVQKLLERISDALSLSKEGHNLAVKS